MHTVIYNYFNLYFNIKFYFIFILNGMGKNPGHNHR